MRPLIGLTTAHYTDPVTGWLYFRSYAACVDALVDAGGAPVMIPIGLDDDALRDIHDRLDGVLLIGGGDVNPQRYGAALHPATDFTDDQRDAAEIALTRWAVDDDRPILGICRGHQVMNVALGGTLIQDIPTELKDSLPHDVVNDRPEGTIAHTVRLDPASRLARIVGETTLSVNSLHHQAVDQPGRGLSVTAFAPDEVIEAAEMPDRAFVLSVQWHPEDMYEHDEPMKRLFRAFIEAARERGRR